MDEQEQKQEEVGDETLLPTTTMVPPASAGVLENAIS